MTDITISEEDAKFLADKLRTMGQSEKVTRLIELLDPPLSLLDEAALAVTSQLGYGPTGDLEWKRSTEVVLSVVRRHIEGLVEGPVCNDMDCPGCVGYRDIKTVLRLLGDTDA